MNEEMIAIAAAIEDGDLLVQEPFVGEGVRRRRRFTVDEYHRLAAAGVLSEDDRIELIVGEILWMAPIGPAHAGHVNALTAVFHEILAGRCVVSVQNPIRLSRFTESQPDLMLLEWRDDDYRSRMPAPADVRLLVEVADSSLAFDRGVKLRLYARAGIPEVWLVDIAARRLTVHRDPGADGYAHETVLGPGDRIAPRQYPDAPLEVIRLVG